MAEISVDYKKAQGWLTENERITLYELAKTAHPSGAIVNIGVEYGASLACLRSGNPEAKIIGIDIDMSKVQAGGYGCELIEASSADLVKNWKIKPLSLVFVDGDHGYEGVKADCGYARFVRVEGVIAFHDCYNDDGSGTIHNLVPGVNRAVSEWAAENRGRWEEIMAVDSMRIFKRRRV